MSRSRCVGMCQLSVSRFATREAEALVDICMRDIILGGAGLAHSIAKY